MDAELYPLKFEPICIEKPWGGRRLESLGRSLPGGPATTVGESWELVDLSATAATTADGRAARSVIRNGPLRGKTLHDAIETYGESLLGRLTLSDEGGFPLLVKFLDARENLSIQVHPDRAYQRAHPGCHLKSEAWYIMEAAPGAAIFKGVREGVNAADLGRAAETGDEKALIDMLIRVPVKAGDCHYLASGTCHALGAGILVAEVQTPSDTTFRLYDWGRSRLSQEQQAWHREQALKCVELGPPRDRHVEKRSHIAGFFTTVSSLIHCDYFRIEKVRMTEGYEQEIPYDQPAVWIVLEGEGRITPRKGGEPVGFSRGDTMLVPANMNDARVALLKDTVWLEVTFPQANATLLA